ncbi:phosphatase PAP2 family protein [Nakamurella leprariae]|uniref:Phosphatase PAP2 family protein n=1 Tax=Nakamurella leprariae TaxID=2803911 RepID=A0A938YBJ9_9ACTN|nr:phosphatase PAP2 family protein [Nakamurella leprariae]MBM9469470.1 phosphatase PAP2 family protein [Nakamurella leprariae]
MPAAAARRLGRSPRTTAWPSGRSANAVAFTTAAVLVSPRRDLPLVPVAAAVAFSRVHVGAHWVSDVVGGVALGAAVGVCVHLVARRTRGGRQVGVRP